MKIHFKTIIFSIFTLLTFNFSAFAASQIKLSDVLINCDLALVGDFCYISIDKLHPTQMNIGMQHMHDLVDKYKEYSPKKIKKLMLKKVIPVVIKNDNPPVFYIVDRHHFLRSIWELNIDSVIIKVIANIDNTENFWDIMQENNWVWLKNRYFEPISPALLPKHIKFLSDDPFRTLAGYLEDDKYFYKNKETYFIEFYWANWLRTNLQDNNFEDFDSLLKRAKILSCSDISKDLPGYPGESCFIN